MKLNTGKPKTCWECYNCIPRGTCYIERSRLVRLHVQCDEKCRREGRQPRAAHERG